MCCFVWTRAGMVCALITQRTEMKLLPAEINLSLGIFYFSYSLSLSHSFLLIASLCTIFLHIHSLFCSCKCFYFWLENKTCGSSHIQSQIYVPSSFLFILCAVSLFHSFPNVYDMNACRFAGVAALKAHITKNAFVPIHKQNGLFSIFNMILLYSLLHIVVVQRCVCLCVFVPTPHWLGLKWIGSDQKSRTSEMWRQHHRWQ